jgi:hypothetical protein
MWALGLTLKRPKIKFMLSNSESFGIAGRQRHEAEACCGFCKIGSLHIIVKIWAIKSR